MLRPARVTWQPARAPEQLPQRQRPTLRRVPDAFLTRFSQGRLATPYRPRKWTAGAVHDAEGRLVRSSQRVAGASDAPRVAADPARVRVPERQSGRVLEGTWLYGGNFAHAYGHFLTETLTTMWPSREEVAALVGEAPVVGIVMHTNFGHTETAAWHRRFLELAGWDLPVHVVAGQPEHVDELVVPARSFAMGSWALPQARTVWDRVASGFRDAGGTERVYLSRTRFNLRRRRDDFQRGVRTSPERDQELDAVFGEHGFEVVHPQGLSVDAQMRIVASAGVIAGLSGSALHQSAFMPTGGRVIEVGDSRTADSPVPSQVAIDAACGHRRVFLPADTTARDLGRHLRRLGLS